MNGLAKSGGWTERHPPAACCLDGHQEQGVVAGDD